MSSTRTPGPKRSIAWPRTSRDPQRPAMARPPRLVGIFFYILFLVLPSLAVGRVVQVIDWRVVVLYFFTISMATMVLYYTDKRAARIGGWRTPETVLHLAELGGGWAAAYLAQQSFRHKTSKTGYQVTYWLIGFLHQFFACDYLLDWRISRGMFGKVVSGVASHLLGGGWS
ncbi:DUF1294 domain-containing protein [Haloferula sp. BvORR071]|uniref:DUF1294 domain-containing protein n=1 Tax=Haloferula sp. BvORR071 TaxID=1396141 RepID=UPI000695C880|nr:DUF1294 domain-containing protein [Haloferula sp. BvORR071]